MEVCQKHLLNLTADLMQLQNEDESRNFCDLKLVGSDGYILCHKSLLPNFQQWEFPAFPNKETHCCVSTSSEGVVTDLIIQDWSLKDLSKLVLLLYTGETILSKNEYKQLVPLLTELNMSNNILNFLPTKDTRNRKSSNSKSNTLVSRKVRCSKKIREQEPALFEDIFVFGNGSEMAIPVFEDIPSTNQSGSVCYDEDGFATISNDEDLRLFCLPCSLIFCDKSDFVAHSIKCENKETPEATLPKAIKIEADHIKIEVTGGNLAENLPNECSFTNPSKVGTISVCLVCVKTYKDTSGLIVHCYKKHDVSPEKDYDLDSWKCKRCLSVNTSGQISVFLQHVFHCKTEKTRTSRKRSAAGIVDVDEEKSSSSSSSSSGKRQKMSRKNVSNKKDKAETQLVPEESQISVENTVDIIGLTISHEPENFEAHDETRNSSVMNSITLTRANANKASKRIVAGKAKEKCQGGLTPPISSNNKSTLSWQKTNKNRNLPFKSVTSMPTWPCRRCLQLFATQKQYMCHICLSTTQNRTTVLF